MGGEAYWYYVPYRDDLQGALDDLRAREFAAGRYNPVVTSLDGFGTPAFLELAPGPAHASIDDAVEAAMEEGTRSILDITDIGTRPDYATAAPLPRARLVELFGTERPTHAQVERCDALFADIDRGQCVYVIVYDGAAPTELFFAGYSYD